MLSLSSKVTPSIDIPAPHFMPLTLIGPRAGPSFWDQGILTFTKLDRIESINNLGLKNLPLNECFMVFGAIGLLFNILARSVSRSLLA